MTFLVGLRNREYKVYTHMGELIAMNQVKVVRFNSWQS